MSYSETSDIFGKEKGKGVLKGIIDSIYQSAFGEDAYPSIEEKAANLLYFIIKDHPFVDGCKRIAATTFLYFLGMNRILYKDNKKNTIRKHLSCPNTSYSGIKTPGKRNHD